jgi:hypothetical protein
MTCRLCEEQRELCLSHALPESAFRLALRECSGKAITITGDEATPVQYSSDTWDVGLLCSACEDKLNKGYDAYGIAVLKGHVGEVRRNDLGITFSGIDRQRLRMFCLSVLWRVSVSHHNSYSNIDLPFQWEQELHRALQQGSKVRGSMYTVAIYRLRDSTPEGFSYESLRSLVTAPFARRFKEGFISVCFVFFGFLIEIFLPKLPQRFMKRPSVLTGSNPVFMAPFQEILEVPELLNLMVTGLHKHETGLSRVGSQEIHSK